MIRFLILFCMLAFTLSCSDVDHTVLPEAPKFMEVPYGFESFETPLDNAFSQARWELGKKLFYDFRLSIDGNVSCASCHKTDLAFSDNVALSSGVNGRLGTRNAPTLANVAYHPYLTRDGSVPTLEIQILIPIQEHNEFAHNIVDIAESLAEDPSYKMMALQAYNRTFDPYVITRALACFERSLISGFSPYDQYVNYHDKKSLSQKEINGMELFFSSRTHCSSCHSGTNFTNYAFENNGLYENYTDLGRMRFTDDEADLSTFKVPSLRNIAVTAPYMHDGSLATLQEVIDHYNSGGKQHINKSELVQPLNLSEDEKNDLIVFLHALTDASFINNPIFME